MDKEEQDVDGNVSSSQSASSYASNEISRRTALKRLGVVVGAISLAGFGFFNADSQARATLEDMDDPATGSEEHSSLVETYASSLSCCKECNGDSGCSIYSYVTTSSSSWTYWWS